LQTSFVARAFSQVEKQLKEAHWPP